MLGGWYSLRIVSIDHPDPGVGGMYLTLGPHGEVVVEAMGPHNADAQKWFVQAVNGGTDVYVISKREPHVGLREEYMEGTSEVPVVFGPGPEQWRITGGDNSVYLISPNKQYPVGVEHLVDTDGRKVMVKTFPVYPGDRPAWKFESIEE